MAANTIGEVPDYWIKALLVWFLALSIIVIGLSFWTLEDIPAKSPVGISLPAPPVPPTATGSPTTVAQTELYERQTAAYQKLVAAYVTTLQAAKAEQPDFPRLKAYKAVVVDGLLVFVSAVFTAMFATVVGNKALTVAREYFARK